ncbi:hypothetical protein SH580_07350 [Coraliomargarita algicola]|uniref:Uncharacterized protein n=1 Tax=Coraliomargarita algicola TaxID=3092156 RepID=A0ABZ0RQK4_9BACT|nr:hypothetical protein [Coraliomargarita sp. J2-16]WPJ97524.1 hypothetical protein SH580_07350 [Coraliomargarita sp. J2-16]
MDNKELEVTNNSSHPNGIQNMFDVKTGYAAHYIHQHLPHLSTMCTTGGFFLPKSQKVRAA